MSIVDTYSKATFQYVPIAILRNYYILQYPNCNCICGVIVRDWFFDDEWSDGDVVYKPIHAHELCVLRAVECIYVHIYPIWVPSMLFSTVLCTTDARWVLSLTLPCSDHIVVDVCECGCGGGGTLLFLICNYFSGPHTSILSLWDHLE